MFLQGGSCPSHKMTCCLGQVGCSCTYHFHPAGQARECVYPKSPVRGWASRVWASWGESIFTWASEELNFGNLLPWPLETSLGSKLLTCVGVCQPPLLAQLGLYCSQDLGGLSATSGLGFWIVNQQGPLCTSVGRGPPWGQRQGLGSIVSPLAALSWAGRGGSCLPSLTILLLDPITTFQHL